MKKRINADYKQKRRAATKATRRWVRNPTSRDSDRIN
jgi:hypothetical protein